jgi:hypothetical protein
LCRIYISYRGYTSCKKFSKKFSLSTSIKGLLLSVFAPIATIIYMAIVYSRDPSGGKHLNEEERKEVERRMRALEVVRIILTLQALDFASAMWEIIWPTCERKQPGQPAGDDERMVDFGENSSSATSIWLHGYDEKEQPNQSAGDDMVAFEGASNSATSIYSDEGYKDVGVAL